MTRLADQGYVKAQYKSSKNLQTRIQLHERFSVNKYDWFLWVFDHFKLPAVCRVLEVGCGTGQFWKENLARIP
ncbi:MAG: MerR family transcriptional regulator, partial [Ardenticatenaceae bacterium]